MPNKDTVFILQGYDEIMDNGTLSNVVFFEVFAKTKEEAIEKAKKYDKKPHYRVSRVIETKKAK